ncbi:MAG: agmatinase family protein [Myxococcales bacterium]|nr:agmatinase family protein [Myxococcales bacterium]
MATIDPNAAARPDSGLFGLDDSLDAARVVIVPVPFDATTSYHHGTAQGPAAILRASHQVDLYDVDTGRPYAAGIHMLPLPPSVQAWNASAGQAAAHATSLDEDAAESADAADEAASERQASLDAVNQASRAVERYVADRTRGLIQKGKLVGVLGGDHSVPLGAIVEHAAHVPGMGILHIDAHADLRVAYQGFAQSHASIMHNVLAAAPSIGRLVQVGIRDLCEAEADRIAAENGRIRTFFDSELALAKHEGTTWMTLCEQIVAELPSQVYVSVDIDGLDPALCPHTGTPVPGGLQFAELVTLLRTLVRSGRQIVGFDLCEVAPAPAPPRRRASGSDGAQEVHDEWDACVGARVLYKLIGFALLSQSGPAAAG